VPTRTRLLVAYLATPGGADALSLGIDLARALHGELDIAMVLPPMGPIEQVAAPGNADYTRFVDDRAAAWLAEATATIPDDIVAEARIALYDNVAEGLITEAQQTECAAIVVGGSGGGIVGRHSLGSVVNDLLHSSPLPVVLTPRGAASNAPHTLRRITCAIGRRPGSTALFTAGLDLCERTGLPLRLVSLVTGDDDALPWRRDDTDPAVRAAAGELLDGLVDDAHTRLGADHQIASAVVAAKTTETAVIFLDWDDGDIVLVGSSRLAQPLRLFLGTTAAKMLRALSVPMIVVPTST
jgi:nucleotide-binding universal stress UspA family protein